MFFSLIEQYCEATEKELNFIINRVKNRDKRKTYLNNRDSYPIIDRKKMNYFISRT